jgi:hypothetical protein
VERLVEYLDLPQEPPAVIENSRPPAYWPSSNTNASLIKVEDLVVRYAPELPPVLHGISFELRAKERIGLLGRTGMLFIFRSRSMWQETHSEHREREVHARNERSAFRKWSFCYVCSSC